MLNCKIKPFRTPVQKYSNKNCCKRSVFFHQGFECTFSSKCYLFVPVTTLLGKSCQVEDFLRLLKIFLGIWDLRISKYRQLWIVGPALCCGSIPVALSKPSSTPLTPSGLCPLNMTAAIIHKLSLATTSLPKKSVSLTWWSATALLLTVLTAVLCCPGAHVVHRKR